MRASHACHMGLVSRHALVVIGVLSAIALSRPAPLPSGVVEADPAGRIPHASKVAVMVLENRAYEQVIGSPNAPYLNRLARRGALETRYYALTHPSLPNYIALTTGSTRGVHSNCSRCSSEGPSLLNQMNDAGIDWGAYFQSLPHDKDVGPSAKLRYNRHYNPFVYTESLAGHIDQSRLRDFGVLKRDLAHHTLPRFTWIAPNVRNDGHNHPLRRADREARRLVPKVLRALGPRGVLYLTWDESVDRDVRGVHDTRGGGRIALIAAGGLARRHARVRTPATHVALLRTIEANFGLPELPGVSGAHAPLLTGLLR
jgi:phosphatidylinositol-3-phosphatase